MTPVRLTASSIDHISPIAKAMANIHALSFETGWSAQNMQDHLTHDYVWAMKDKDTLCAFIIIRLIADQADIITLATAPTSRRAGYGRTLLAHIHQWLPTQGGSILFLDVAEDNAPAIALYEKFNYERFLKRPAYYRRKNGRIAAYTYRKIFS